MVTPRLVRISLYEAAEMLGVSPRTVVRLARGGAFTDQRDGVGRTARRYFLLDEVETYIRENAGGRGSEGKDAVRNLRIDRRRKR